MTNKRLIRCVILLVLVTFSIFACHGDAEITTVDFSKRVSVERPSIQSVKKTKFRVAVAAMISPRQTVIHYHQLLDYIAGRLGKNIQLVQRKTYSEINELVGTGQIDLAFICSGPYATGRETYGFEALAVPQIRGKHNYRSYLIVHKESPYKDLSDLKGKVFAFTDPDSNTGKLVPTYWLIQQGDTPENFFRKIIYTYSHDNSIMAVATSLVDAAAVHEQIWQYYRDREPFYTAKTRIIRKSIRFGNPLLVVSRQLPDPLKDRIRDLLFSLHRDTESKKILQELMIDRFILPQDEWYQPIVAMQAKFK
jgi:phosphonate transport system substrate-binding protein